MKHIHLIPNTLKNISPKNSDERARGRPARYYITKTKKRRTFYGSGGCNVVGKIYLLFLCTHRQVGVLTSVHRDSPLFVRANMLLQPIIIVHIVSLVVP